ncbi:MAG: dihydroorotate dehydrogenase electron transfer subunit [bacterium]
MQIIKAHVDSIQQLQSGIYLLKILCREHASQLKPGQFCNIKVSETNFPLLRRPFSICDVDDNYIYFMFNVHGEGTKQIAQKRKGDLLDILGPLGNGFSVDGDYNTAIIIAGGMGSAPFPFLTKRLKAEKKIFSFVGGRSQKEVITYGLENVYIATDDGSMGFKGNVVALFESEFKRFENIKIRVFACGPNAMLKTLQEFCIKNDIDCQISTECAMACGFGICQGCAIESSDKDKYLLVCKDGPIFNAKDVIL